MLTSRSSRAAVLALLALAGCASSRRSYQDGNMDFGSVRNVAVLPFANLSREPAAAERVRDVFSNHLLSTGAVYVLPPGEVARGISRLGITTPAAPSTEEVVKLGQLLKVDAVIVGVVKEYGEVRSASSMGNVIALSLQMQETTTGKVVWAAASTKGGITLASRLFGGGGSPVNEVTEEAVDDLLDKMFP